jgi:hypothetical protein
VIGDLHWLIHQGHVIEFANGVLETAKRPLPKPVRAPKPKDAAAAPAPETVADSAPAVAVTTENSAPPVVESTPSLPLENIVPVGSPPSTPETVSDPAPQDQAEPAAL